MNRHIFKVAPIHIKQYEMHFKIKLAILKKIKTNRNVLKVKVCIHAK